ncbi:MAG: RnfABCDGE type electron transport complex subunit G [Pseudomonadota bacterium]
MSDSSPSWRSALTLTLIAAGCAAAVAAVFALAEPRIAENREQERLARYQAVLAGLDYDAIDHRGLSLALTPVAAERLTALAVRGVYKDSTLVGLMLEANTVGYSGPVRLAIATDRQLRVLGVRVLAHKETPGIGDFIETRRGPWIEQFAARSLDNPDLTGWETTADGGVFDAVTGATVTARAVVRAIRASLQQIAGEERLAIRLAGVQDS